MGQYVIEYAKNMRINTQNMYILLLCTQNTQKISKYAGKYAASTQNTQNITQRPFGIRRIVTCSYSAYSAYSAHVSTPHFADA